MYQIQSGVAKRKVKLRKQNTIGFQMAPFYVIHSVTECKEYTCQKYLHHWPQKVQYLKLKAKKKGPTLSITSFRFIRVGQHTRRQ